MAKKIDITDMLSFDTKPSLLIRGEEYTVNDDAETMLKVMGILGDGNNVTPKDVLGIHNLIFSEKERKRIAKINLNFSDFQVVVEKAIDLITGSDEKTGE